MNRIIFESIYVLNDGGSIGFYIRPIAKKKNLQRFLHVTQRLSLISFVERLPEKHSIKSTQFVLNDDGCKIGSKIYFPRSI